MGREGIQADIWLQAGHPQYLYCFPVYKTDLEKDIVSDTSGDFRKLMVALAKVGVGLFLCPGFSPDAPHPSVHLMNSVCPEFHFSFRNPSCISYSASAVQQGNRISWPVPPKDQVAFGGQNVARQLRSPRLGVCTSHCSVTWEGHLASLYGLLGPSGKFSVSLTAS